MPTRRTPTALRRPRIASTCLQLIPPWLSRVPGAEPPAGTAKLRSDAARLHIATRDGAR